MTDPNVPRVAGEERRDVGTVRWSDHPFEGPGETRALARATDWAATPLGPVEGWPEALKTVVRSCLDSPFPINLWCGEALVLIYNDAYRPILGAKHPSSFARPGRAAWSEIWPEIEPMFEQIRAGGPPIYAEDAPFVVRRATAPEDAETPAEPNAWFTFSLSPVRDARGEIVAFLNVVSETTRRVQAERSTEAARATAERAEAQIREVFAQAPAFLAMLRGPDHVFEYVNHAYYQLVGHRELLGLPVFEALPEVRGQGFEALLDNVMETGEPFIGREVPVLVSRTPASQPERRFVDVVYYPITDHTGQRTGVVAHGSDVTEHVLARREAQRALAEAEHANQSKSQFLANMSHEIRTPINAVIGYTDLLDAGLAGTLNAKQQQYVERVKSSSRHLLGLVNDVLDLAKIEAGEMTIHPTAALAASAVSSAVEMVAPQAEAQKLVLRQEWRCHETTRFRGDEDRLRQILLNLLSNSLKFTPEGGTITVRCRVEEQADESMALPAGGPWIVLEVEDTGAGIAPEHLARIFDPFVQADAGHTRRVSGTGLGLTISRRLARLMGGELTAHSRLGAGSCFTVWLASPEQEVRAGPPRTWADSSDGPDADADLVGLDEIAKLLVASVDRLEDELVDRLRNDSSLHIAATQSRAQLADHTAALITVMAKTLTALELGDGELALLHDGQDFQAVMAGRHGRQRRRLGWARADVEREYEMLHDIFDGFLRREAPKHTAANIGSALPIIHRLLGRARATSLAAFNAAGDQSTVD